MNRPPDIADRRALLRNRARAARAPVTFLAEQAAVELEERLGMVNRAFTAPALVTGDAPFWAPLLPGARVVADDDRLDLEPGAHDLVVHALALHWAADPVGQLVQCRRALRPDGLFIGLMWGGQTLAELRSALSTAESTLTGGLSPRVLPMAEIRDLGALLQRAGFALPVADLVPLRASYPDIWRLMRDLRGMGEQNAMADRRRSPAPRVLFETANRVYSSNFAAEGGRLLASFDLICLAGWAPDATQPQPLRPGSAAMRLADALAPDAPAPTTPAPGRDMPHD